MGAGAAKAHGPYPVAPSLRWPRRPADAVDFRDDRPSGPTLHVDADALELVLAAAGVTVGPHTKIRLRLRAQAYPGQQGQAERVGADDFRIVVRVASKQKLEDGHLYVVNNSVLHELRHVAQMQADPDHANKYAALCGTLATSRVPPNISRASASMSPSTRGCISLLCCGNTSTCSAATALTSRQWSATSGHCERATSSGERPVLGR